MRGFRVAEDVVMYTLVFVLHCYLGDPRPSAQSRLIGYPTLRLEPKSGPESQVRVSEKPLRQMGYVTQHPPMHHPLETHYDLHCSSTTESRFHLGNVSNPPAFHFLYLRELSMGVGKYQCQRVSTFRHTRGQGIKKKSICEACRSQV